MFVLYASEITRVSITCTGSDLVILFFDENELAKTVSKLIIAMRYAMARVPVDFECFAWGRTSLY